MDYAMENPFIGHRRPRMRDLTQQLFSEAPEGERRGRRGGRGADRRGTRGGAPHGPGMGPGFGPHRGGGRRRRGDVRLAALLLIAEEPRNGYQIIQELDARSNGHWKPSPGAVYPALSQLQDEGLIQAVDNGKAFEITEAGRAEAEAAQDRPKPWEREGEGHGAAHELHRSLGQVGQAIGAITQSGNEELIAKATAELTELKRRLYQLLAEA